MSGFNEEGSFARRILESQGWTKGKGLGKKSQGIVEAIKPSLKFDTTGVGHDPSKEFTDHWWARAYDDAAGELQVDDTPDGSVEVKKRKRASKKDDKAKKSKLYSGFVKTSTLDNGVLRSESPEKSSSTEVKAPKVLSDEELFAACEGLTAHKGARHGHSMSAKYKRLEELDKELLDKISKSKRVA